jgi:hypothetical protein
MKRRCFAQNAPFYLKGNDAKMHQFRISPLICAFFYFGPWFRISSIKSLIGHQTSIFMQYAPDLTKLTLKNYNLIPAL